MSEPLTTEHFDEVITTFKAHVDDQFADVDQQFAGVDKRLDKIDSRLDAIEKLLWQGERLDELERRVIKLAEITGAADLATPFMRPIAT